MKKIKIILLALVIIFGVSCDDDGGSSVIELKEGAVPDMVKDPATDQIIDLVKVTNGDPVNIGFSAQVAQGEPVTTDIVGYYKTFEGPVYKSVLFSDVTLPMDFTLNADDIVNAFSELNSTEDILLGDILSITARFTLDDGTVINILNDDGTVNTGTNLASTVLLNLMVDYPVSCPSDLGGVYNVVSNGDNTDGQPPAVNLPYTVTITDNGGGSYTISDGVAGVYIFWYSIYGYTFETPGKFTDICGNLGGSWVESFGCQVDLTGTVNPDGTLSIRWDNCFGDYIDAVYTPE
ncbi:MAG: hypothetical protein OEM04_13160 [Flavobacteriaceae bacterium]|nr:hypothetical protein [Flavobacteriaceae bacterium]